MVIFQILDCYSQDRKVESEDEFTKEVTYKFYKDDSSEVHEIEEDLGCLSLLQSI